MALQEVTTPAAPPISDPGFLAADPHMVRLRKLAERVAPTPTPILIVGGSGAGKEALARFIHRSSDRHGYPLVKLGCASTPHDLLEAELFGQEGDAGSPARRAGKLELARHGTLLLDEIGEMGLDLQTRLLQVLEEEGCLHRVGGLDAVTSAARIIATSSRPLDGAAEEGAFRQDLFHRLKAIRFTLPPLRERRADIPLLCEHFLRVFGGPNRESQLPERLGRAFDAHGWPDNVRELEHLVRRYTILPDEDMVLEEIEAAEGDAARANRLRHRQPLPSARQRTAHALGARAGLSPTPQVGGVKSG